MDYTERDPELLLTTPRILAGEWYLKGFVDAYSARVALVPFGPAGDEYNRGYQQGLAAVQRDFFAAMRISPVAAEPAEV